MTAKETKQMKALIQEVETFRKSSQFGSKEKLIAMLHKLGLNMGRYQTDDHKDLHDVAEEWTQFNDLYQGENVLKLQIRVLMELEILYDNAHGKGDLGIANTPASCAVTTDLRKLFEQQKKEKESRV